MDDATPASQPFQPASAAELVKGLEQAALGAVGAHWAAVRQRVGSNLQVLADTAKRTAELRRDGKITDADVDAILYAQEQLLNSTLLTVEALPYVMAQGALSAVFKLVGEAVSFWTGGLINPFP